MERLRALKREKTYKSMILYVVITIVVAYIPIMLICNQVSLDDAVIHNKYGDSYKVEYSGVKESYKTSDSDLSIGEFPGFIEFFYIRKILYIGK